MVGQLGFVFKNVFQNFTLNRINWTYWRDGKLSIITIDTCICISFSFEFLYNSSRTEADTNSIICMTVCHK